MRKWLLGGGLFLLCAVQPGLGATYTLPLHAKNIADLGGLSPVAGWPEMTVDMAADNMKGRVTSQPFTNGTEYYYFYQVMNVGDDDGFHVINRFTIWPFQDADGNTEVGYLTGDVPSPFVAGTEAPTAAKVYPATNRGPTIAFDFDGDITYGQTSRVLYVKSTFPPGDAIGNIIDGAVAKGDVIGAVPEPATVALLGLGLLAFVGRKRS